MKSNFISLIVAGIALLALSSCDVIDGPKVDPNGFTGSTNKVLVEDFTGHMCGNCPQAHEAATSLKATYGENLVVVAVHAGGFARVIPTIGYGYDFNTVPGADLESYFQADATTGLPIGLVNRRVWGGSALTKFADWGTDVGAVLAESPKMSIDLATTFDPSDHSMTVNIDMEYFVPGTADHQLVVLITEDSIIAQQADYRLPSPQKIVDYVHNHVLRAAITPNSNWGVPVKGNVIVAGEQFTKSFTATLDPNWVPEHCHIVAFVTDNATKEVIQVEETKLVN